MPMLPRTPQDESAVEPPINGATRDRRVNIESPVRKEDGAGQEAHTPRPHPPVEEPEDNPQEHAPETEPDDDADSDQRQRPPRPGKAPR